MEQVVDSIISSARGLEPELELLSRTDGLKQQHEKNSHKYTKILDEIIASEETAEHLDWRANRAKKTYSGYRQSFKRCLYRATINKRKLEARKTSQQNISKDIDEELKENTAEHARLVNAQHEMQSVLDEQMSQLEERMIAQNKVDEAYQSWFRGQVPPTYGVHITGVSVMELEETVETLKSQVESSERSEEILSKADTKMRQCVSKLEYAQDLPRDGWIRGRSYKCIQHDTQKIMLAAYCELGEANQLVVDAQYRDLEADTIPLYKKPFPMDRLTIQAIRSIHEIVDQQWSMMIRLRKSKKSRLEKLKSNLAREKAHLAEAMDDLKREQREAIWILAGKEYWQSPPLYVPHSSGTTADTSQSTP